MESTTQDEKALLRTIIQKIIAGDEKWLTEKDIIAQEKSGFYIVNYNQFGEKNEYSRLVRGMVIEKPAPGSQIQDVLSLIRSFPFTRFFNKAEESADKVNLSNADMLEKLDGSMVGVFFLNGNIKDPHWHTRRMLSAHQPDRDMTLTSFHGKEHHLINLIGEYVKQISFDEKDGEYTFVFEFIHDATTVWTKYGEDKYGLHLIGARNLSDHAEMSEQELDDTAQRLGTPRPKRWDSVNDINVINSLMQQMAKEISGFEGFVFRDKETGKRIKLKDEDYVRFHHMLDKLTYKNLLINVIKGETDEILSYFPKAKERMDVIYEKYVDLVKRVSQQVIKWRDKNLNKKELVEKLNGRKAKRWDIKTGGPLERIPPAVKDEFTKSCIMKYVDNNDDTIHQKVDEEYKKLVVGQGKNLGQLSKAMKLLGMMNKKYPANSGVFLLG